MFEPMLIVAFAAGGGLGALYLYLLWRSTARLAGAASPGRTTLAGAGLRIALVVAGFWLIGAGAPWRLLAALAGFLLVRQFVLRHVRGQPQVRSQGAGQ